MKGFIAFVRRQGVVGLAIGFMLGGAVNKVVSSLVADIIQPFVGFIFGKVPLADLHWKSVMYGNFISNVIDFVLLAAVVYFIFKGFRLEYLDLPKEEGK
jgi:large conductance mechanosensitive channel